MTEGRTNLSFSGEMPSHDTGRTTSALFSVAELWADPRGSSPSKMVSVWEFLSAGQSASHREDSTTATVCTTAWQEDKTWQRAWMHAILPIIYGKIFTHTHTHLLLLRWSDLAVMKWRPLLLPLPVVLQAILIF